MENLVLSIVPLVIGIAIGYVLYKYIHNKPKPVKEPDNIISVSRAIQLHENYTENDLRYENTNQVIGNYTNNPDFKDTQFVWFSKKEIREYLDYLDYVEYLNPNNNSISGIRVYFGAYTDHPKYENQQTVFFTPTIKTDIDEEHDNMKNLPFSIIPSSNDQPLVGYYKIIEELLIDEHIPTIRANQANSKLGNKITESKSMVSKSAENDFDDGTSLSYNFGQASPPPPKK